MVFFDYLWAKKGKIEIKRKKLNQLIFTNDINRFLKPKEKKINNNYNFIKCYIMVKRFNKITRSTDDSLGYIDKQYLFNSAIIDKNLLIKEFGEFKQNEIFILKVGMIATVIYLVIVNFLKYKKDIIKKNKC